MELPVTHKQLVTSVASPLKYSLIQSTVSPYICKSVIQATKSISIEKNSGVILEKQFNTILQEAGLAQYRDDAKHNAIPASI